MREGGGVAAASDAAAFNDAKLQLEAAVAEGDAPARIYDERTIAESMQTSNIIVMSFFGFATLIAMTISFFSLVSSTYVNIYEQSKEIGILRALGLSKGKRKEKQRKGLVFYLFIILFLFFILLNTAAVFRTYVYEAFLTILAACLIGLVIGNVVAYTMLLQQAVLSQLPM